MLLFCINSSIGQSFDWARTFGSVNSDAGVNLCVDDIGNVYTTGYFNDSIDLDPDAAINNVYSSGSFDVFIQKMDASGNLVWARSIGGASVDFVSAVEVDKSGNVYVLGRYIGTADFDPGPAKFNLSSNGIQDVFLQKMDAAGNFVWAKSFGGAMDDFGEGIAFDSTGHLYLTGRFAGTVDFNPSSGVFNLSSAGDDDVFVQKLDTTGNFIWARALGGPGNDFGQSIQLDASGNIYTVGNYYDTIDLDPGPGVFNAISSSNNMLFEANSSEQIIHLNIALEKGSWSTDFINSAQKDG